MRLQNKVTLITGGAAGIGKATALTFAREGAKVAICDVNEAAGQALLPELGPDARFDVVNVAWVENVKAHYGKIDVLVNNAGIVRDAQLIKVKDSEVVGLMSDDQFDLVISINLKGVFNCTRAVVPHLIAAGGGAVLNASSVVGLDGNFGQTNYVATKSGVVGMTKVWARELGRYGIRVNAVAPGFIATEIIRDMPEKVLEGMVSHTPLRRMGQPEDIANAYLFLASDEASFISGVTLRVDGGLVVGT
jgi:3-oxoacyl-[acyl-carrier protein] reductase